MLGTSRSPSSSPTRTSRRRASSSSSTTCSRRAWCPRSTSRTRRTGSSTRCARRSRSTAHRTPRTPLELLRQQVPRQPARRARHVARRRQAAHPLPQLPRHGHQRASSTGSSRGPRTRCRRSPESSSPRRTLPTEHREPIVNHMVIVHPKVVRLRGRSRSSSALLLRDAQELPRLHLQLPAQLAANDTRSTRRSSASTAASPSSSRRRPRSTACRSSCTEKKIVVDAKTKDVEALIADIKGKTEIADAQQEARRRSRSRAGAWPS